jgi:hypothetical protein
MSNLSNRNTNSPGVLDDADLLTRLHALPGEALFDTDQAAFYLNARRDLLRTWRWQRCGPAFEGRGHFVRYRKKALDEFMTGHADRLTEAA